MGPEGIVCGFVGAGRNGRARLEDYDFGAMWRVIRHPLSVLETLPGFVDRPLRGLPAQGVESPPPPWSVDDEVLGALQWWNLVHTRWSHLPAVRIERYDDDCVPMFEELRRLVPDLPTRPDGDVLLLDVWRSRKSRRFPRETWESLRERYPIEAAVAERITEKHYGTI